MSTKNIEVELRGQLSKEKFNELQQFFAVNGEKVAEKDRILIDYSTFLPGGIRDRQKDIRIRVTNGVPEIIVKIGTWGGDEQRKELSVTTERGTFDTLAEIFAVLGFEKGVLCVRKTTAYQYKDIEFALVEVPGHSYYFEAEKMTHTEADADLLRQEMMAVCTELGLTPFSEEEFFAYVEKLNAEANEVFEAGSAQPNYFKERFGV